MPEEDEDSQFEMSPSGDLTSSTMEHEAQAVIATAARHSTAPLAPLSPASSSPERRLTASSRPKPRLMPFVNEKRPSTSESSNSIAARSPSQEAFADAPPPHTRGLSIDSVQYVFVDEADAASHGIIFGPEQSASGELETMDGWRSPKPPSLYGEAFDRAVAEGGTVRLVEGRRSYSPAIPNPRASIDDDEIL